MRAKAFVDDERDASRRNAKDDMENPNRLTPPASPWKADASWEINSSSCTDSLYQRRGANAQQSGKRLFSWASNSINYISRS